MSFVDCINVSVTSFDFPGGTGDRRSLIRIALSDNITSISNPVRLVRGDRDSGSYFAASEDIENTWFQFDFLYPAIVDDARIWFASDVYPDQLHGIWEWQGSTNGTDWTSIGDPFTLGGVVCQYSPSLNSNVLAYRYYRLHGVSGSRFSFPEYMYEVEFKIAYNINNVSPSYDQPGGRGYRLGPFTVSTNVPYIMGSGGFHQYDDGAIQSLIDGSYATNYTNAFWWWGPYGTTTDQVWVRFDLGSPHIINEATWWTHNNPYQVNGVWQWQGSNDDQNWDNIGATFGLTGSGPGPGGPWTIDGSSGWQNGIVLTTLHDNITAYRYYRMHGVSGDLGNDWEEEIDFQIGTSFH